MECASLLEGIKQAWNFIAMLAILAPALWAGFSGMRVVGRAQCHGRLCSYSP